MKLIDWFKNFTNKDLDVDRFTNRDFKISILLMVVALGIFAFGGFLFDKASCAYKGYTYEKNTKRPIFSECLIQMKDGSYVPLDRYINRVLTFNDIGNGE